MRFGNACPINCCEAEYAEIAETTAVPLPTIKARMRAAVHKLQAALGD